MQLFKVGEWIERDGLFRKLVGMQYGRNDTVLTRGTFRVKGEVLEIFPAYAETRLPDRPVRRRGRGDLRTSTR